MSGSDANTDSDGSVATAPLSTSAAKELSFMDSETEYSRLLNGCQMKAANGSGLGEGGKRKVRGSTLDCVLSWIPTMTDVEPMTESPNAGKVHAVVDVIHPFDFSCETNFETLRPSWSGWTKATKRFKRRMS